MSSEAVAAVWAMRGLEMGERIVLLRLAEVAHPDGSNAFLAVRTIADDAEIDRATVQRNLRKLERKGVVTVQREATNRRPTTYKILLASARPRPEWATDEEGPQDAAPSEKARGRAGAAPGPHRGRTGAAPVRPDPDPDPDPEGRDHTQPPYPPRVRSAANEVGQALVALHDELTTTRWSFADQDFIGPASERLTLDDVRMVRAEVMDYQPAERTWRLACGVIGRVDASRRADPAADPWARDTSGGRQRWRRRTDGTHPQTARNGDAAKFDSVTARAQQAVYERFGLEAEAEAAS